MWTLKKPAKYQKQDCASFNSDVSIKYQLYGFSSLNREQCADHIQTASGHDHIIQTASGQDGLAVMFRLTFA